MPSSRLIEDTQSISHIRLLLFLPWLLIAGLVGGGAVLAVFLLKRRREA